MGLHRTHPKANEVIQDFLGIVVPRVYKEDIEQYCYYLRGLVYACYRMNYITPDTFIFLINFSFWLVNDGDFSYAENLTYDHFFQYYYKEM